MADMFNDIGNWWNNLFQPQVSPPATNRFAGLSFQGASQPGYAPSPASPTPQPTAPATYTAPTPNPNSMWSTAMPNTTPTPYIQGTPQNLPSTPPSTMPSTQSNPQTYDDGTYTYMYDEYGGPGGLPRWVIVGPSQTLTNEQNRIAQEEADRKFNENARQWGLEYALSQQNAAARQQEAASTQQYQQQQLAAEQAWRTQQLEAEKQQRLATLSAQPKSWLEYAALANQPPVVQPWMLPLMPQDYMNQAVGSPIAGWTPENMKGMPDLINPSAQYMARLSPDQRAQYYGYQQADTGQTPESMEWRLWSQAPAGSVKNLSYSR